MILSDGLQKKIYKWAIGGGITILGFVLVHTGMLIWTLSNLQSNQIHIQRDIAEIKVQLVSYGEGQYDTQDAAKDFETLRAEFVEWKKIQAEIDRRQWESIKEK